MSISKSSSSSPSLPSSEPVSGDIFFQVKKEILDKLDLILQKVNLEVIEYLKPQTERKQNKKTFHFIELSQFQKQIQTLFDYLDRLYESLNTSVSFSSNDIKNTLSNMPSNMPSGLESTQKRNQSILQYNTALANELGEIKMKYQHLEGQMHRLTEENEHMMFMLKNNMSHSYSMGQSINVSSKASLKNTKMEQIKGKESQKSFKSGHDQSLESNISSQVGIEKAQKKQGSQNGQSQMEGISFETVKKILRFYNHSIRQLATDYKESVKEIKRILKEVKFQVIESRVECISELKKWSEKWGIEGQDRIELQKNQEGDLKDISSLKEKSISEASNRSQLYHQSNESKQSQKRGIGFQTNFQTKEKENTQNCGDGCFKKGYDKGEKGVFEDEILHKIQEILDVC